MIPTEITREHILAAIARLATEDVPAARGATRYELLHEGVRYPPKYVVALAAKLAVGRELAPDEYGGGDETNRFLERLGFVIVPKDGEKSASRDETSSGAEGHAIGHTWMFHANPELYDLRGALRELTDLSWAVRQHRSEIAVGDCVFLWESGPGGGVVARARVLTPPATASEKAADIRFWKVPPSGKPEASVRLAIEKHLAAPLAVEDLRADPVLAEMPVFRMAQRTNSELTPSQGALLTRWMDEGRPVRIVKIAAGREAEHWFECIADSYICVGWDKLGDLRQYGDWQSFRKRFGELYQEGKGQGVTTQKAQEVWTLTRLRQGDKIVANRGTSHVLSVGTVREPGYVWRPERDTYKHTVSVDWDISTATPIPPVKRWAMKTIDVVPANIIEILELTDSSGSVPRRTATLPPPPRPFTALVNALRSNLWFSEEVIAHYLLALQSKRFVLLTGISGTGKTQLALQVARHLQPGAGGESHVEASNVSSATPPKNYDVVAVRPDWTDGRGLLGFYNPLTRRYVTTPFLRLLLRAEGEMRRARREQRAPSPFFAVLDEMNLARVEHYFSDFLSSLESGEPVVLHDDETLEAGAFDEGGPPALAVPRSLVIPPNLFLTGTVNVDETTHMFSPKVLDRAFVIEFNDVDLASYGARDDKTENSDDPALRLINWSPLSEVLPVGAGDWDDLAELQNGFFRRQLVALNDLLAGENRHFGYRVANEIARFLTLASEQCADPEQGAVDAFDLALMSKVLPKLHGTQQEVEGMLVRLFAFTVGPHAPDPKVETWSLLGGELTAAGDAPKPWLPRSSRKLYRMIDRARRQGFTSFIE